MTVHFIQGEGCNKAIKNISSEVVGGLVYIRKVGMFPRDLTDLLHVLELQVGLICVLPLSSPKVLNSLCN